MVPISRAQAEARYLKLLEVAMAHIETLEATVRAAPNTKLDVKSGVKAVSNPDVKEQRFKLLQL